MALDIQNTQPAYLLGRLLAMIARIRQSANSITSESSEAPSTELTSDDIDRVMTHPAREIHRHLLQAYADIQIAAEYESGITIDRMFAEVMAGVVGFPENLSAEDKGLCWIGYYHQMAAFPAEMARVMDEINDLPLPSPAPSAKMSSVN